MKTAGGILIKTPTMEIIASGDKRIVCSGRLWEMWVTGDNYKAT
jgi:hypothetical protein